MNNYQSNAFYSIILPSNSMGFGTSTTGVTTELEQQSVHFHQNATFSIY